MLMCEVMRIDCVSLTVLKSAFLRQLICSLSLSRVSMFIVKIQSPNRVITGQFLLEKLRNQMAFGAVSIANREKMMVDIFAEIRVCNERILIRFQNVARWEASRGLERISQGKGHFSGVKQEMGLLLAKHLVRTVLIEKASLGLQIAGSVADREGLLMNWIPSAFLKMIKISQINLRVFASIWT